MIILLNLKLKMTTEGVGFAIESVQFDKKFIGTLYGKVYCTFYIDGLLFYKYCHLLIKNTICENA